MKKSLILFSCLLLPLLLCACGKAQTVTVFDSGVTTTLEVALPQTVASILDRAEITLQNGDEVSPGLDVLIRKPQEIIVRREAVVLLDVYGEVRTAAAYGLTVSELLEREGIILQEGQHLNCKPETWLKTGMEIRVSDMADVQIVHDGTEEYTAVSARTVGAALSERGIQINLEDRITPSSDTVVTDGMRITVQRIRYEVKELTEAMPFETVYEKDETLPFDSEQISVQGSDGLHRVKYRITTVDGIETDREVLSEIVLNPPGNQIIKKGPKDLSAVSIVSRRAFYDCDGSGHGYYEIRYSDDTVEYERF